MEIEIVTTKKKLSKSIISQMNELQFKELDSVEVLGYVNNINANTSRVLILQVGRFEYRKAYWDWNHDAFRLYRRLKGSWTQERKFNKTGDCKKYYDCLQDYKKQAVQIYI